MNDLAANGSPLALGVVSNVWSALLPGSSLVEQCQRAAESGFQYVELRQRALGECESLAAEGPPLPDLPLLLALRASFPELGFNLAVEAPFLTEPLPIGSQYLQRCLEAAWMVGGGSAVLRLVDVSPAPHLLRPGAVEQLGRSVATFASEAWTSRVSLVLENSKQPLGSLRALIRCAAEALPQGVPVPNLCWDPHNQFIQTLQPEDPLQTARSVPIPELFEFHFKQSRDGALQGEVGPGDLDWRGIVEGMVTRGFRGPALFEIPPGPDVWERLERSTTYVRSLLPPTGGTA